MVALGHNLGQLVSSPAPPGLASQSFIEQVCLYVCLRTVLFIHFERSLLNAEDIRLLPKHNRPFDLGLDKDYRGNV